MAKKYPLWSVKIDDPGSKIFLSPTIYVWFKFVANISIVHSNRSTTFRDYMQFFLLVWNDRDVADPKIHSVGWQSIGSDSKYYFVCDQAYQFQDQFIQLCKQIHHQHRLCCCRFGQLTPIILHSDICMHIQLCNMQIFLKI